MAAYWKVPPLPKIYEALSAVGDGRVTLKGDEKAEVISSSGSKTYLVEWSKDLRKITSNDNASYWRHYLGYPIIAVLMAFGKVNFNEEIAKRLSGVPWKELNKKFRNDYNKAVDHVLQMLESGGIPREEITAEADRIMKQVKELNLEQLPRKKRPPS